MTTIKLIQKFKSINSLFSDTNLTRKAYLNALASALEYAARLAVGFLITPIMVAGLGDFLYGMWQTLNRVVGYISPSSGRPTQALKWTLANLQASDDYVQKRKFVGSTILVWLFFLPLLSTLGGVITWSLPYFFKIPAEYLWPVRLACGVLVINLAMINLSAVPKSILEGQNLGYKRMGLNAFLILVGGGLTWLALYLHTGLIGVALSTLATTVLVGVVFLVVARSNTPWIGVVWPTIKEARQFLGLSGWFLGWNLIMQLMNGSDVVILGILISIEAVTNYTITKYLPETMISFVAIVVFAITPGLGGIIGSGNRKRAGEVRGEIMALTWLIVTVFGTTILILNRPFLSLWVGPGHFVGEISNLLVIVLVTQFVFIRNDANIIDLTLQLRQKVILGFVSVALSILLSVVLVSFFNTGIVGLIIGFILGRIPLSLAYPWMIGRFLGVSLSSQLKGTFRPVLATIIFLGCLPFLSNRLVTNIGSGVMGWITLVVYGGITGILVSLGAFFIGLSKKQRRHILNRFKVLLSSTSDELS